MNEYNPLFLLPLLLFILFLLLDKCNCGYRNTKIPTGYSSLEFSKGVLAWEQMKKELENENKRRD